MTTNFCYFCLKLKNYMQNKKWLLGLNPSQYKEIAIELGLKPFAASQIARWVYHTHVGQVSEMTNLPVSAREALSTEFEVGRLPFIDCVESADGTKKYLFPTLSGDRTIEAVYIPDKERATL